QLAERLNNLIPNGRSVSFVQTEDGRINAIVRPEDGSATRTFSMTPQQFNQYALGPSSVFDIAAQAGIEKKFAQLTGSQGAPGQVQTAAAPTRTTPGGIPITTPGAAAPTATAIGDVYDPVTGRIRQVGPTTVAAPTAAAPTAAAPAAPGTTARIGGVAQRP